MDEPTPTLLDDITRLRDTVRSFRCKLRALDEELEELSGHAARVEVRMERLRRSLEVLS